MKKILSFGSINIDHVYQVSQFVQPGETISCLSHRLSPGGKGFNQTIALARAGCPVWHAGKAGSDAAFMLDMLKKEGVDTSLIAHSESGSGHTIIQVDSAGQNCIIVCPGANGEIQKEEIDAALSAFQSDDLLLAQNETSHLPYLLEQAAAKGMKIYLNPSPISPLLLTEHVFDSVCGLILNETEGEQITGVSQPEKILDALLGQYPHMQVILTLGSEGVRYADYQSRFFCPAVPVRAVDTTAAGDTFTGYFLAGILRDEPIPLVLQDACKAAAIAVTRPGAAESIPYRQELR